jgi:predicted unusual protein kinase regulating ubiquinone biosynthesis (AarF/ABC1/UbiB family)
MRDSKRLVDGVRVLVGARLVFKHWIECVSPTLLRHRTALVRSHGSDPPPYSFGLASSASASSASAASTLSTTSAPPSSPASSTSSSRAPAPATPEESRAWVSKAIQHAQPDLSEPLSTGWSSSGVPTRDSTAAATSASTVPSFAQNARPVPSTRLGRLAGWTGLAATMAMGAMAERVRHSKIGRLAVTDRSSAAGAPAAASSPPQSSDEMGHHSTDGAVDSIGAAPLRTGDSHEVPLLFGGANSLRLANALCRMRGAALKLGQMLSIQGEEMLPPVLAGALERVRQEAEPMPEWQLRQTLCAELGDGWESRLLDFDPVPLAAASIGQVHRARVCTATTSVEVAVKVQYPGVAQSIDSDLDNLRLLLRSLPSSMLPSGLHLEPLLEAARAELKLETNYEHEAECQTRFRTLLADRPNLAVPRVLPELCSARVLTAELAAGLPVERALVHLTQHQRDWLGFQVMELCLRELFEFRFMQTDPNWSNFLLDIGRRPALTLLDFGACRHFAPAFVEPYRRVVAAAARQDADAVHRHSIQLGFLTGEENDAMREAHVESVLILGEPFRRDRPFDFARQNVSPRIRSHVPTMAKHRLTPPPQEIYSLHRKLSGAFLLCSKLGARVNCHRLLKQYADDA